MSRARAVLGTACGTHFIHDGFSDILYVLLPVWARELGLNFAQVGLLRTLYSGGMAVFQIPAGLLAERWGEAPWKRTPPSGSWPPPSSWRSSSVWARDGRPSPARRRRARDRTGASGTCAAFRPSPPSRSSTTRPGAAS